MAFFNFLLFQQIRKHKHDCGTIIFSSFIYVSQHCVIQEDKLNFEIGMTAKNCHLSRSINNTSDTISIRPPYHLCRKCKICLCYSSLSLKMSHIIENIDIRSFCFSKFSCVLFRNQITMLSHHMFGVELLNIASMFHSLY